MRSESGMGRSRNLLTPWAHRKRNIATVKITDQTMSTAHEGKLWTWFNLLQHVSELREARTACRKRRLSLRSRPRGCAAAQRLCWPALAHKHEVKKNVLHCELLCSSFFFQTQVQLQTRLSGKLAWQHQHVAPLLQQHPCVLTLWVQVWACGCQLMNYSVKILQMAKSSDRARK